MGRILISEEEKQRILGMHVEKGYSSLVSEQSPVKTNEPIKPKRITTVTEVLDSKG